MYKIIETEYLNTKSISIKKTIDEKSYISIPIDPANTDYAQFKKDILEDAELIDADGKSMTSAQAIAFVKELP